MRRKKKTVRKQKPTLIYKLKGWLAILAGSLGLGVMVFFARNLYIGPAEIAINQALPELPVELISDKFSGNLNDDKWYVMPTPGSSVDIQTGRLKIVIPADSADRWAGISTKALINPGKDFAAAVTMKAPQVVGSGLGCSTLLVQKDQTPWTWTAEINWCRDAGAKVSYLDFSDSAAYRPQQQLRFGIDGPVTVKLSRQEDKYLARYTFAGQEWKKLGEFTATATDIFRATVIARNFWDQPAPQVTGFFDDFTLRIEK